MQALELAPSMIVAIPVLVAVTGGTILALVLRHHDGSPHS
jgi:hypothetical protein